MWKRIHCANKEQEICHANTHTKNKSIRLNYAAIKIAAGNSPRLDPGRIFALPSAG